jgi:RNA polymerase sigma-70 factor, ECF subfamily
MLTNDKRLVRAARRGDHKAFTNLVQLHFRPAYLLALKVTRDPEDAREVVQESLFKAYLHLSQFQEEARFSTWLGRITLNEALMRIRRRAPLVLLSLDDKISPVDGHSLPSGIPDERLDPESACRSAESRRIVHRAIHSLAPHYRSVFILRHVQDFSTRETAEILRLSVTTVKTRLRRARSELRRRLHDFHESGCRGRLPANRWRNCNAQGPVERSKTRSSRVRLGA